MLSSLSYRIGLFSLVTTFCAAFGTGLLATLLAGNSERWIVFGILIASLALAVALAIVAQIRTRRLLRPLVRLSDAATRLATGDLTTPIPVVGSREVRALGRSLENARHELEGITRWLTHEKAWAEYLVDSMVEGIVALDAQNRVIYLNKAAATLIGTKTSDAIGKAISELLIPAETDGLFTDLLPEPGIERTIPVVRPDSRTVLFAVTGSKLKPPVESGARTTFVFRDVTAESAMQRLQSYFLGNLSHELQTPLASLRTSAELLVTEHDELSHEEHHKLHTGIYRGILRLEALIDNLLASASVQAGRFKVKPRMVDVAEPIEDAMLFMRPLMDAVGLELDIDLPVDLPLVCADSQRVTQVLVNLLSNTIKYTPPDSTVQVTAAVLPDHMLRIGVADRGPGIPAESREIIFARFGRLDTPGARKDHGAGLGLYIARTIVDSHGGSIGVEPRPGGGTIFWFTLPLKAKEQETA
jgi:two-component system phosphate regulon sensor histidine kinase PhoR